VFPSPETDLNLVPLLDQANQGSFLELKK